MKYFVFSLDDGTIWDKDTISLFNKYGFKGTFNLNSGLQDFVWYYEDRIPITRLDLGENVRLYDGHEICSHTHTHPYLDQCDDQRVVDEVNWDVDTLQFIFGREIKGFATPFETCGDREVYLIKNYTRIQNIRLSELDESFSVPTDPYHIKVTALDIDRALDLFEKFLADDNAKLFVYAGHSYDFYVNNSFDKLERLLQQISSHLDKIKVVTMSEMVEELF